MHPNSARWLAPLPESAFNQLGQYGNSRGNRANCYAELVVPSLAVAATNASTHFHLPTKGWPAWVDMSDWFTCLQTVTHPSVNPVVVHSQEMNFQHVDHMSNILATKLPSHQLKQAWLKIPRKRCTSKRLPVSTQSSSFDEQFSRHIIKCQHFHALTNCLLQYCITLASLGQGIQCLCLAKLGPRTLRVTTKNMIELGHGRVYISLVT